MRDIGNDRWRRHLVPLISPLVADAKYPTRRLDVVYFGDGEATVPRPYRTALLARVRRLGPEGYRTRILIRGYANSGRGSTASHILALRRSMAVAEVLYAAGTLRGQVRIGAPEVLTTEFTPHLAGRSYNRRVELLFQPNALAAARPGNSHQRSVDLDARAPRALNSIRAHRLRHRHGLR